MTWLTWRQSRIQFLTAAAALVIIALAYGLTASGLNHLYAVYGTHPAEFLAQVKTGKYPLLYFAGGAIMYLAPVLIGAFWGAPMIARELEAGTSRLVWNQSVTRTRWLLVKLAIGGGAAMAFAGIASLLLSWWSAPIDKAGGFPVGTSQLSRFAPLMFGTRGIVPVGAAALAFTLGVTVGLLLRRVIPAMAVTVALLAALLFAMPAAVSPHLISPAQYTRPVVANLTTMTMTGSGQLSDPVTDMPGAWILSDQIITSSGTVFALPDVPACQTGTQAQCDSWLARQSLRQHVVYQPASRYWTFQILETLIWLAIAVALAGVTWRRIRAALRAAAIGHERGFREQVQWVDAEVSCSTAPGRTHASRAGSAQSIVIPLRRLGMRRILISSRPVAG
jgi:ABC-type transport system involved in multi-copper enzyme maturation permease subunit